MICAPLDVTRLLEIIRAEYREMPGLHLTRPQAQRLWSLDSTTCECLLKALESEHFLKRAGDAYLLARPES